VRFSQAPWTIRLVALLLCPVAGGAISVIRHLTAGPGLVEFAYGYAFGLVACLLLGAWLHISDGHDVLGRRARP
jgi:hypothetical protein